MTNSTWKEESDSSDHPAAPRVPDWLRRSMHLHAHGRPSNQTADTLSNVNNNALQGEYLNHLEWDYDVDLEEVFAMQSFESNSDTTGNIDTNLMNSGSNDWNSSPPLPAPHYCQPPQQMISNPLRTESNQHNNAPQFQHQSAPSPSYHDSVSTYSQINTAIAPAQLTNMSKADLISLLIAHPRDQDSFQNQPYCLPPSGQHGMGQPAFNINTSNFNSAPQYDLHPDSNHSTQCYPHTIDPQRNPTLFDDEVSI